MSDRRTDDLLIFSPVLECFLTNGYINQTYSHRPLNTVRDLRDRSFFSKKSGMFDCIQSAAILAPDFFRGLYFKLMGYFLKYKTSFKLRKRFE